MRSEINYKTPTSLTLLSAKSKKTLLLSSYEAYLFLNGTAEADHTDSLTSPGNNVDIKGKFVRGVRMVSNALKVNKIELHLSIS